MGAEIQRAGRRRLSHTYHNMTSDDFPDDTTATPEEEGVGKFLDILLKRTDRPLTEVEEEALRYKERIDNASKPLTQMDGETDNDFNKRKVAQLLEVISITNEIKAKTKRSRTEERAPEEGVIRLERVSVCNTLKRIVATTVAGIIDPIVRDLFSFTVNNPDSTPLSFADEISVAANYVCDAFGREELERNGVVHDYLLASLWPLLASRGFPFKEKDDTEANTLIANELMLPRSVFEVGQLKVDAFPLEELVRNLKIYLDAIYEFDGPVTVTHITEALAASFELFTTSRKNALKVNDSLKSALIAVARQYAIIYEVVIPTQSVWETCMNEWARK